MADKQFPLSLVIKAVDKATGPIRAMTAKLTAATSPLTGLGKDFGKLGEALNVDGFMKVGSALKGVGSEIFSLVGKFAALGIGAGLAAFSVIKGAVESGDKLSEMADRVGLSIDSYAALQHAAGQADIEQEAFAQGMDKFNKQLGDMTVGKGGKFLAFLNEISPVFAKQVKGAKSTEEAFFLVTDAMSKIEDPQRRATLAAAAFGKSNTQFGSFLKQGRGEILKQEAAFMRLTGSQERSARAAGDMDNAAKNAEAAFLGLRQAAAGGLLPALTRLTVIGTNFIVKNRAGIEKWAEGAGMAIDRWVSGGGLERLSEGLSEIATAGGKVVSFLGPVGTAAAGAALFMGPLISSFGTLGVALIGVTPQLIAFGAVLIPLLPEIIAVTAIAGVLALAGYRIYEGWEPLKFIFDDWGNSLRWSVIDTWNAVRPYLAALAAVPGMGLGAKFALGLGDSAAGQTMAAIEARRATMPTASEARGNRGGTSIGDPAAMAAALAHVSIDIKGLPAGSVVTPAPGNTASLDLSTGFMSVQP